MRRLMLKVLLLFVWLLVGSLVYGAVWNRNVDLFPPYPGFLRDFLYSIVSSFSLNIDTKFFFSLAGSLFYVIIYTLIAFVCFYAYKHLRNKLR